MHRPRSSGLPLQVPACLVCRTQPGFLQVEPACAPHPRWPVPSQRRSSSRTVSRSMSARLNSHGVARALHPRVDREAPTEKLKHLGHERNPVEGSLLVERREDLLRRPQYDLVTCPHATPPARWLRPTALTDSTMFTVSAVGTKAMATRPEVPSSTARYPGAIHHGLIRALRRLVLTSATQSSSREHRGDESHRDLDLAVPVRRIEDQPPLARVQLEELGICRASMAGAAAGRATRRTDRAGCAGGSDRRPTSFRRGHIGGRK